MERQVGPFKKSDLGTSMSSEKRMNGEAPELDLERILGLSCGKDILQMGSGCDCGESGTVRRSGVAVCISVRALLEKCTLLNCMVS